MGGTLAVAFDFSTQQTLTHMRPESLWGLIHSELFSSIIQTAKRPLGTVGDHGQVA